MPNPPAITDTGWMLWLPEKGEYLTLGKTKFPEIWTYRPVSNARQTPVEVEVTIRPKAKQQKN